MPEIDLIVGGHSHELLGEGETVNETLIVQVGSHGRYAGIVEVKPATSGTKRFVANARIEAL